MGDVFIDYGSIYELGGDDDVRPMNLTIERVSGFWYYVKYFRQHPKEDVRIAYKFFVYALWIGVLSILIGLASLFATIFEWTL